MTERLAHVRGKLEGLYQAEALLVAALAESESAPKGEV
jgi:hypothetical protein